MKTDGAVQSRARSVASGVWWGVVATSTAALVATWSIRPEIGQNFFLYPWGNVFPALGMTGLVGMLYFNRRKKDFLAFLSSSTFIAGMLASTAFGLYPYVLPASTDPNYGLTIFNTAAQHYGLSVGLTWWVFGMILTSGYFFYMYRSFHGKTEIEGY
jgi:cytochrome d ubiquinol oxidase subunit II